MPRVAQRRLDFSKLPRRERPDGGEERRQAIDDAVNTELKSLTTRVPKIRLKMPREEPGITYVDWDEDGNVRLF